MKRRTLAILLTALLVVSVVFVLAACQKEYTVTFRDTSGRVLDTVTTVKGKATATDKATTKTGYTFEDWYKTIGQDDDGNYTYTDKVDLATYEFTEDTDLYAKWKRNLTKGEEAGYCLIGQIYGVTVGRTDGEDWDKSGFLPAEAAAEEALQFTYAQNPINLYTKTFDVKVNHKFKMKTSVDTWDGGEINGLANILNEVKLASNVTLPQGIAKASDLFDYEYGIDNNLIAKCDMNLTINFYYNAADSYADVIVNSLDADTVVKEDAEYGFILTGTAGVDFKPGLDPDNATEAPYILTQDATNKNLFTLSEKELAANTSFRLKVNNGAWSGTQYNYSNVTIKFADDLDHEGVTEDDLIVNGGGDDQNLNLVRDIKATISLDAAAKTWTLTITWFSSEAPKTDAELGYLVVCTGNNFYDKGTVDPADPEKGKYVMVVDENSDTLFAANGLAFTGGQSFRVKLNVAGWQKEYNYTNAEFVFATGVTPPAGIADADAMFKDAGSGFDGHNIIVQGVNITADITLDTSLSEKQLKVTIKSVEVAKTDDELGYIVVGDPTVWQPGIAADSENARYIMTVDENNAHLFTYGSLTLLKDKNFRVKVNNNAWSNNIGYDKATFVFATGVEHEGIATAAELFKDGGGGDRNIQAAVESVTFTLSLNTENGIVLTVTVTAYTKATSPAPEAKIGTTEYPTLAAAITAAQANDEIVLQKDVVLNKQIVLDKTVTLNLNGKTISNTENIWNKESMSYGFFALIQGGNLTVKGNGKMLAKEGDCYAISVWDAASKLVLENGQYVGNSHCIYVYAGEAEIKGGEYSIFEDPDDGYKFTLNLFDANGKNGTAKIIVTGGSFVNYDPSNSASEAPEADFVAEGFEVTSKTENGKTIYTVAAVAAQA